LLASCVKSAPLHGVGVSSGAAAQAGHEAASASPAVSPVPDDFTTRFVRLSESFVSWGHAGGRTTASVFVNPEAKDLRIREGFAAPPGTLVVMTHVDRQTDKAGPTYFMLKDAAQWTYGVVSAPKETSIRLCARCHSEAPHDSLFALP
jgi:hypothetical protein